MMMKSDTLRIGQLFVFFACLLLVVFTTGLFRSGDEEVSETISSAQADGVPVGTIFAWAGDSKSIPEGWKLCDGRQLGRKNYAELFKAIGTTWGGTGKRFNLPDLRGRFLRGVDAGSGRDPDKNNREASKPGGNKKGVGSVQDESLQNHAHKSGNHEHGYKSETSFFTLNYQYGGSTNNFRAYWSDELTDPGKSDIKGVVHYDTKSDIMPGEETRPKNAAVHFIIKVE